MQSSAVPHIIEADKIGEKIMLVKIYKDNIVTKKVTDMRYLILHKDKTLEIETENDYTILLDSRDYDWFNII